MTNQLIFQPESYRVETVTAENQTIEFRVFENIPYVTKPVNPEYQVLSIFVPEAYYRGEQIGDYSLHTAPVFMPNSVGGYMPGKPEWPGINPYIKQMNSLFFALQKGYVVVSPGIRGNELTDEAGKNSGVAPACIVDYKAAVRYLRKNKDLLPGDMEKIISNGTSAGGALSALLGSTGNHPDYEPYLEEIGAAKERDDIFAASCYCPITNLEHADMAYEWEFCGINEFHKFKFELVDGKPQPTPVDGVMETEQIALSREEKQQFSPYLNSLGLKDEKGNALTLDEEGNGSFRDYVAGYVMESAQRALAQGEDLSDFTWLTLEGDRVTAVDFNGYVVYATRMKDTPAFDSLDMVTPENMLFGNADVKVRHFTELSKAHSHKAGDMAEPELVKLLNPMNYIKDEEASTAANFRIRHGAKDRDTSLAIPVILKTTLQNAGISVDFHLPWGRPHSGDYDLPELFSWIEKICK